MMRLPSADFHHAGGPARQRRLIDDAQPASEAEELQPVPFFQSSHQRQHFAHGLLKRTDLRDLGADVHLQPPQAQVLQLARPRVNALDLLERDAELVLVGAGGDLLVRVRFHVRVHAHGHRRGLLQARRHAVDALQLRLALSIERIDPLPQGELDFAFGLAHAGKGALAGVAPGRHHPLQLAAADDVEPAAQPGQRPQHGLVRVGLDGEADQVLHSGQGLVQVLEMLRQRMLRIDVKRRAEAPREGLDGDPFAAKRVADVTKVMHGAGV